MMRVWPLKDYAIPSLYGTISSIGTTAQFEIMSTTIDMIQQLTKIHDFSREDPSFYAATFLEIYGTF